jgi:hypothetical protein
MLIRQHRQLNGNGHINKHCLLDSNAHACVVPVVGTVRNCHHQWVWVELHMVDMCPVMRSWTMSSVLSMGQQSFGSAAYTMWQPPSVELACTDMGVVRKVVKAVVVGAAQHNGCSRAEQVGGGDRCAAAETNRCNLLLCAGCCCNVLC